MSLIFLPCILPLHPLHMLLIKFHADISALGGHDGHADVGAGDVGHLIHHRKPEFNFGFSFPNYLDRLFGTYRAKLAN